MDRPSPTVLLAAGWYLAVGMLLPGCVQIERTTAETLPPSHSKQLLVFCKDHRVFKLDARRYEFVSTDSGQVVRGEGWVYTNEERTQWRTFAGSIPMAGIDSLATSSYVISPLAAVGVGLALLFALLLGRSFWGL
jgi:hypothetical protein